MNFYQNNVINLLNSQNIDAINLTMQILLRVEYYAKVYFSTFLNSESILQADCCRPLISTSKNGILREMTLKLKTQITTLCLITSQYLSGTYLYIHLHVS